MGTTTPSSLLRRGATRRDTNSQCSRYKLLHSPSRELLLPFFCRPVASREEALGVPVDFMGSPMFFPDLAHGVIYLKKFNPNTGSADMLEFRTSAPQEQRPSEQQATFAPLNDLLQLKDDLDNLKTEVERLKKPAGKVVRKNESDEQ